MGLKFRSEATVSVAFRVLAVRHLERCSFVFFFKFPPETFTVLKSHVSVRPHEKKQTKKQPDVDKTRHVTKHKVFSFLLLQKQKILAQSQKNVNKDGIELSQFRIC